MPSTAITNDTIILRSNELLSSDLDNETVMMDIERGDYYGLDSVGARIWALAEAPVSFSDICEKLQAEYEVSPEQCESDVTRFLGDLLERGIVRVQE